MPCLPLSPHFVSDAPQTHIIGFGVAIDCPAAPLFALRVLVTVGNPTRRFFGRTGSIVDANIGFSTGAPAKFDEFVRADLVALFDLPGRVKAFWARFTRANAVFPVISAGKVATRIANYRRLKRLYQSQYIFAQSFAVFRPYSTIDAALKVLDKMPVNVRVDLSNGPVCVDTQNGALPAFEDIQQARFGLPFFFGDNRQYISSQFTQTDPYKLSQRAVRVGKSRSEPT